MARSESRLDVLERSGARAVVADGLDQAAVHAAVSRAMPEVVVHEMTALHGFSDVRRFAQNFAATNRLRTTGTDILLAAAVAAGARHYVTQSFAGILYDRTGAGPKTETDPIDPSPFPAQRTTIEALRYLETKVADQRDIDTAVSATAGSTDRARHWVSAANRSTRSANGSSPSSAPAPECGPSCMSTTPRQPPPWPSTGTRPAPTTSSTTNQPPLRNGSHTSPESSTPHRHDVCLLGWPVSRSGRTASP